MSIANLQIAECYDSLGMSPEEIASDMGLETAAVKLALSQSSAKFRSEAKKDPEINFSESEQELAKRTIASLMQNSEDDHLRFRAAKYLRDDSKGRLDLTSSKTPKLNVSIGTLQLHLQQVNQSIERSREQRVSNIPSVEKKMLEDSRQGVRASERSEASQIQQNSKDQVPV